MRKKCLEMVYALAREDERVFFVGSDLGFQTMASFQEEMPDRFLMVGISEAAAVGIAAGLAMEGAIPFVNTIATFLCRRALEQVAVDLCMHDLPVRLIGNGGGLVYAPLGSTHLAVEDIALMRALPNMTVVCPADAEEMARFMPLTLDWPHPIYIRLAKGYDPVVTRSEMGFEIGRCYLYRRGGDVLLVTTGVCLGPCLEAAETLAGQGVEAGVVHMPTVKPLDVEGLLEQAKGVRAVLTVEEHTVVGGLGSAVAESLLETVDARPAFRRLGLPDIFPDHYGTQKELMARYGLSAQGIADAAAGLLGRCGGQSR